MPKIDKPAEVQPSGGILSRIGPLRATNLGRLRMSLYGEAKTGKTRLAATFPKPLLLIGSEDGVASIAGTKGVDFVQLEVGDVCTDFSRIVEALEKGNLLHQGKPYATVVLDTASSLRDLRISEILGWTKVPEQKGFGFASMDQWNQCAQNLKDMMKSLLDLTKQSNVNIVIIAHEQVFTPSEAEKSRGHENIEVRAGSALGKSTCLWLNKEVDYIAQTLIRNQVQISKSTTDGVEMEVSVPTGRKEYALRVGPHSYYYTGFRLPNGRVLTEDFIIDPTYEKLAALIAGK